MLRTDGTHKARNLPPHWHMCTKADNLDIASLLVTSRHMLWSCHVVVVEVVAAWAGGMEGAAAMAGPWVVMAVPRARHNLYNQCHEHSWYARSLDLHHRSPHRYSSSTYRRSVHSVDLRVVEWVAMALSP